MRIVTCLLIVTLIVGLLFVLFKYESKNKELLEAENRIRNLLYSSDAFFLYAITRDGEVIKAEYKDIILKRESTYKIEFEPKVEILEIQIERR